MSDGSNTAGLFLSLVERVEKINEEIKAAQEDRKMIYQEAAGAGINAKAMRRVVRERAMDREELDEFDSLVASYWGELGR